MLNSIYEIFSGILYCFQKMCFILMVVMWLAIKIEPGLFPLVGFTVICASILFVEALFNEEIIEEV